MDTKYIEINSFRLGKQAGERLNSKLNDSCDILVINGGDYKLIIASEALPLLADAIIKHCGLEPLGR